MIGKEGANIKAVEQDNNVKLTLKGDVTTIQGDTEEAIKGAFEQVRATLTNYGWYFNGSSFYEDLEIQKVSFVLLFNSKGLCGCASQV